MEAPGSTGSPFLIWIDAQMPPVLGTWLEREYGVRAVHVEALGLLRASDPDIFRAAREAEQVVVILTKDDDFPTLVRQNGPQPRVVWVRCGNVTNRDLRRVVDSAWPRVARLLADGEPLVEIRNRPDPGR